MADMPRVVYAFGNTVSQLKHVALRMQVYGQPGDQPFRPGALPDDRAGQLSYESGGADGKGCPARESGRFVASTRGQQRRDEQKHLGLAQHQAG